MYHYVDVRIIYKGKRLSKKFYDEHEEIHKLYPSQKTFNELYRSLINDIQRGGTNQLLEISENSIKVNGTEVNI